MELIKSHKIPPYVLLTPHFLKFPFMKMFSKGFLATRFYIKNVSCYFYAFHDMCFQLWSGLHIPLIVCPYVSEYLFRNFFSKTVSLSSFITVRYEISNPYGRRSAILALLISKLEGLTQWTSMVRTVVSQFQWMARSNLCHTRCLASKCVMPISTSRNYWHKYWKESPH